MLHLLTIYLPARIKGFFYCKGVRIISSSARLSVLPRMFLTRWPPITHCRLVITGRRNMTDENKFESRETFTPKPINFEKTENLGLTSRIMTWETMDVATRIYLTKIFRGRYYSCNKEYVRMWNTSGFPFFT